MGHISMQAIGWTRTIWACCNTIEPQQPGEGFEFVNEITGGRIPLNLHTVMRKRDQAGS